MPYKSSKSESGVSITRSKSRLDGLDRDNNLKSDSIYTISAWPVTISE
jgi:hypothetical protein